MIEKPLVSIIILSYENFDHLFNAVKSVLIQDYERIELIVSDDCSKHFLKKELIDFIEENKQSNLENVVININPQNGGTVSNMNSALKHVNGDFYMVMGGDDCYFDENVVSTFINKFNEAGDDVLYLAAQTYMYNSNMTEYVKDYISEEWREIIEKGDSQQIFSTMTHSCIIAEVSCCFKREFIQKVGGYDSDYFILEDRPTLMRAARLGIVPKYLGFVATKHASGGIANGNTRYSVDTLNRYYNDETILFEKEIKPYISLVSPKDKALLERRMKNTKKRQILNCKYIPASRQEKIKLLFKHPFLIKHSCLNTLVFKKLFK